MFPLYDESSPRIKRPFLTIGLIAVNVLVFFIFAASPNFENFVFKWGLIPAFVLSGQGLLTFISSMFLHADLFHLMGNMWFLWLFGDNLEHNLGSLRFLIFYLFCGLIASLVHIFTIPYSDTFLPTIGAWGAISGIQGGYMVLFPKNKIRAFDQIFYFST